MRRRLPGPDAGLITRMVIVGFLLAAVYLFFMAVLFAARVPWFFILIFAGSGLVIQYFFSDKLALLSMGGHEVSPAQAPELHAIIDRLSQQMDLPKPRVAIADTDMPNAFATGRNPKHAVVCCTTGILRRLNTEEMEAVLGHELTHVKNRDVAVITFASFFATVASFIMQWGFWLGLYGGGRRDRDRDGGNAFILVYFASILVWIISFFLIRALSRYRELAADRGSAIVTGAPSHLESALMKISTGMARIPNDDLRSKQTLNAFFIVPAIAGGASLSELFSTHPSLERRIAQLQKIQRELYGTR
ncbi:MAG TPA: zinc metalloprotease HtpX [Dehalococcoidia bacterium]|nr:zinc metalloprotease HtpX [Dehalococcoidia bacterium]